MGIEDAIAATIEALMVIIKITFPTLMITTAIGLVVTLFQSVTQINDQTIQQNLKMAATFAILFATIPAMIIALRDYTMVIFDRIANLP
ncbi:flagellar biosynthetic protein FliQ [Azospirillum sp. TSO22-1]|uniref:flagellar biosynthetic protein FliQ n=1 Tax=Azospirillum sp. TSO22-1 TaxID=716789 RepID=UPI000D6122C6|nr:flagellar biosynthetic protein FliQ [Azospirillum sp. TSO22-1]PWC53426.1 flagellar biosynthesis protein FliQ [Azospirillum sp. TSO22-1]